MSSRKEIVARLARKGNVSKRDAASYLAIILEAIELILARTGKVKLPGFGNFHVTDIPARKGINPLTGKKTTFAPGVRVGFRPGRPLKDALTKARTKKRSLKK